MQPGEKLREWRAGWPLILTGLAGSFCVSAHVYPLGVVMKPLAAEFGWSRAEISAGTTISAFVTLLLATFVGGALDRFGPRPVALVGTFLSAGVMMLVTFAGPAIWTWYAIWTLYALVVVMILPIVWGKAIANAFHASRGLALGIGLSGAGFAAAIYPPLTLWLMNTFGLRGVFPGLGLFTLLTLGPLVVFAFKPPTALASAQAVEAAGGGPGWGFTLGQAVRTSLLWRIVLIMMTIAVATSAINLHLPSLLTDRGLSAAQAVSIVAAIGPSVLAGRWLGGVLLDRFHARWIASLFFLLPAVGCALLIDVAGGYAHGLAAAMLIGVSIGVEGDLLPFLLSRYFGLRHFGAIYGLGMAAFGAGYAIGPLAAGLIFDSSGSYSSGLLVLSGCLMVAGLVALTLHAYPDAQGNAVPRPGRPEPATT